MAKIKWSEQDVIDSFQQAMATAASMPSPQEMAEELMRVGQAGEISSTAQVMPQ
jgi:hypothetical protein